jgi:hypothetical protein
LTPAPGTPSSLVEADAFPSLANSSGTFATGGTAETALQSPGSFDVLFGSGTASQHWVLVDSAGVPLDRLPCRRVVPPESGWKLKLAAERTESPMTLDLPSSFDFAPGRRLLVLPRKPFLPGLAQPGSTDRVLLWLLGLSGVAAFEVVGGLYAGGGAAIGSNTTPPNLTVAVPLMAAGGALLVTVVALQASARPGLDVTALPGEADVAVSSGQATAGVSSGK